MSMWQILCEGRGRSQVVASGDNLLALRTILGRIVLDYAIKRGPLPDLDMWLDDDGEVCEGVSLEIASSTGADSVRLYVRRADRWEPPAETLQQESIFDDEDDR